MKCIISHPNIAPYIKESVLAYQEHAVLNKFYTTYFQHPSYPFTRNLIKLFPKFEKEFKRRSISEIEYQYIEGHPYFEMLRILSARSLTAWIENRIWQQSEYDFDHWVARQLKPGIKWVHTYEHAALHTIKKAKQLGIKSFYEQPSQHHTFLDKLIRKQLSLYPELNCIATRLMLDSNAGYSDQRKDKELLRCDYIICNSRFTSSTLTAAGIKKEKILRIPYGFPDIHAYETNSTQGKMTFLFAGNQCLRKGVHILYKAWIACNFNPSNANLIIIGKNQLPERIRTGLNTSVKFIENIPHQELLRFYNKANILVLPTLADGFGMVISEAMSSGLPVITTQNSGGPDIITHNQNGFLVEAGNVEALANQMKWCYENPESTRQIGIKARETAATYPWKAYRKNLVRAVLEKVEEQDNLL